MKSEIPATPTAEDIGLPLGDRGHDQFAAENQRHHEVGDRHEGERRPRDHGGMEMPGHVERVVHQQVDLLGAEHDTRDAAQEAEHHQRHEHTGKGGIAPGRLTQPAEDALVEAPPALRRLDRAGQAHAMNHAAEHGQIDRVAGVEDLPLGADARLGQHVMRAGQLQEQDIEQEGRAADLFRQRLGAEHQRRDGVPHGDMGRDIDLLRGMAHAPPDQLVHHRVDVADVADRPEEGRDQDDGARGDGEDRDDRRRDRAEGDQRHRALIGLLLLGDDQRAEEHHAADQGPDRE